MQKILRIVGAASFLLFILVNFFSYHPVYVNFRQIKRGLDAGLPWDTVFACPPNGAAGALLCEPGIGWQILLLIFFVILGISLCFWVYKEKVEITWASRPIGLFVYSTIFLLIVATFYFGYSDFYEKNLVPWSTAMWSLLSYWLPIAFSLLLVLTIITLVGYRIVQLLSLVLEERSTRLVVAMSLGLSAFIWIFALLGQFSLYTFWPILIVALIALIFSYPVWRAVVTDLFWQPIQLSFSYNTLSWFLLAVLMLVISMNIIDLLRPVPIGWDDLGVYMNFPRQIASKGTLLSGYAGQAYMLITALAFVFTNSTTLGLFFSWFGGILAIFALYAFGKQFISAQAGLLMATMMYLLPMTMHQSFADMKMDMPLFFFIVVAFLCIFMAMRRENNDKNFWILMVLGGAFLGTALAIKITTAIALFPLFALLAWRYSGFFTGLAVLSFLHALYFYQFVTTSDISASMRLHIAIVSLLAAIGFLLVAVMKKEKIMAYLRLAIVVGGVILLIFSPWLMKNWLETRSFAVQALMFGGPAPAPAIAWQKIGVNPAVCTDTSGAEELGRYIGNKIDNEPLTDKSSALPAIDTAWSRYFDLPSTYLDLPWDMTMNTNQGGFYVDISFLFLAFIPLLLIVRAKWWSVILLIITFLVPLCVYGTLLLVAPNLAASLASLKGYIPMIFLLGLLPQVYVHREEKNAENQFWQNVLFLFLGCWYLWLFVASGIPWYGVAGFLFVLLLVVRFWMLSEKIHPGIRVMATVMIVLSLFSTVVLRESKFGNFNMLAYTFGLRTSEQVLAATNSEYPKIIEALNSDLDHPIYRVGTFINYFIDNNRERVFDDPQLDTFKCIDGDASDNARTVERLKALGFRYIIFDTNTDTIEKDPAGTLHKKVKRFTEFASARLKVVAPTDPAKYKNGIILFELI